MHFHPLVVKQNVTTSFDIICCKNKQNHQCYFVAHERSQTCQLVIFAQVRVNLWVNVSVPLEFCSRVSFITNFPIYWRTQTFDSPFCNSIESSGCSSWPSDFYIIDLIHTLVTLHQSTINFERAYRVRRVNTSYYPTNSPFQFQNNSPIFVHFHSARK